MKIGTLLLALAFAMPVGAQTLHDMAIQGQEDDLARKVTAKNIDSLDREEKTMLMVAAENGQTGVVRMLVRAGANPAIQDRAGNTALHYAIIRGDEEITRLLATRGKVLEIQNGNGHRPIDLAQSQSNDRIVEILRASGSMPPHVWSKLTLLLYFLYLIISLGLTVWVARTLSKNGRIFLVDAFHANEPLADSVNHLLVVGFYLINIGYVTLTLREKIKPIAPEEMVESLSVKVGLVLLILGTMHFFNMFVFSRMRKRTQQKPALQEKRA
ncbi:MAG TPA: ankyrin repeat domain-containing protein [Leptospiraceae bacterium]|nr:ankyrin repeat domain-containing protein [Leptospirales bacterium]HMU82856.1 ankyrin repeat domain-containing protein [Leptospiraceae bacterium]HMW59689.1 ankyrin repeat domain-containing protein [Leptospiraceae bacterium]HMX55888.1 ankyrin repeat domain-containing protein [Leptospiraceae bacterium]HMZ37107.1 ankyrin repeat domain-containing protein [Leptospiraceae bacterium]